ncbi:MAG: CoA transferase [Dehalococcoidales bacterium]|jgi:crotonobetainyl-CoA:carnitine CoA-transferase CaiB-like acyl-CoA transferase|nr:CoA transferase [Dehalococcoidales bacterium]
MEEKTEGMLSPYRALDLTDEKGLLCGKILGDLGADVIKIERPGGDVARSLGPFYHDEPDPEKSLFWFALNTSKKGVTLDIETADGQEIFKSLVEDADFVLESFPPGYLDKLGLGYAALQKSNPGIIMVSMTPFGQTGPYRDWKTSDIVAWAISGNMMPWGDPDRPPIRIGHHSHAYLDAGVDGAMGAMAALYHRGSTGKGQQVDVSVLESAAHNHPHLPNAWDLRKTLQGRGQDQVPGASHRTIQIWPCKDGYVSWSHGGRSPLAPSLPLIGWMESEGVTTDFLKEFDWNRPDFPAISQEEMDQIDEPTARFFLTHTKAELMAGAIKYKIMLYPVATTADMLENEQLAARGFWEEVEHSELGATITYPGAFFCTNEVPPRISRRAPLIGEHNEEIYSGKLGISKENLIILKQANVI